MSRPPLTARTRRTCTAALLSCAIGLAGTAAAATADAAGPTTAARTPSAYSLILPTLGPKGTRAGDVRAELTQTFQAHAALAGLAQNAALHKNRTLAAAAAAELAKGRQMLAVEAGGLNPDSGHFRDALAANDAAKLQVTLLTARYGARSARVLAAKAAVATTSALVVRTLDVLVPAVGVTTLATLQATQDKADAAVGTALATGDVKFPLLAEAAQLLTFDYAKAVASGKSSRLGLGLTASNTDAAEVRATLVEIAQGHVTSVGVLTDTGVAHGVRSRQYAGARAAVDLNTALFTVVVKLLSSDRNAKAFLTTFSLHINYYGQYLEGVRTHNAALQQAGSAGLARYDVSNATQLSAISGIPGPVLVPQEQIHTSGTQALIRQQLSSSPLQYATAGMGALHFASVGDALGRAAAASGKIPPPVANGTLLRQYLARAQG